MDVYKIITNRLTSTVKMELNSMILNSLQKAIKDINEEIELLEPESSDILHPAYYLNIAFKKGLEELDKLEQAHKEVINANI